MKIPTQFDFHKELDKQFLKAREEGRAFIEMTSKEIHENVGGYPSTNHRIPVCCQVMLTRMNPTDQILEQPPKGKDARLRIKYYL